MSFQDLHWLQTFFKKCTTLIMVIRFALTKIIEWSQKNKRFDVAINVFNNNQHVRYLLSL